MGFVNTYFQETYQYLLKHSLIVGGSHSNVLLYVNYLIKIMTTFLKDSKITPLY